MDYKLIFSAIPPASEKTSSRTTMIPAASRSAVCFLKLNVLQLFPLDKGTHTCMSEWMCTRQNMLTRKKTSVLKTQASQERRMMGRLDERERPRVREEESAAETGFS